MLARSSIGNFDCNDLDEQVQIAKIPDASAYFRQVFSSRNVPDVANPMNEFEIKLLTFCSDIEEKRSIAESVSRKRLNSSLRGYHAQVSNESGKTLEKGFMDNQDLKEGVKKKMLELVKYTEELTEKMREDRQSQGLERRAKKAAEGPAEVKNALISFFHKDWNLIINMMIGLHKSLKAIIWDTNDHIIHKYDYRLKDVFELRYDRSISDQGIVKGKCLFTNYAPYIFSDLRKRFGVKDESVSSFNPVHVLSRLRVAADQPHEGRASGLL